MLRVVDMNAFSIAVMEVVIVVAMGKKVVHILCQRWQKKHSQQKQAAFPEGICSSLFHRLVSDRVTPSHPVTL